jgi:hypothetical protein
MLKKINQLTYFLVLEESREGRLRYGELGARGCEYSR